MNKTERQKEKYAFSTTLLNTRFFHQHQYTNDTIKFDKLRDLNYPTFGQE